MKKQNKIILIGIMMSIAVWITLVEIDNVLDGGLHDTSIRSDKLVDPNNECWVENEFGDLVKCDFTGKGSATIEFDNDFLQPSFTIDGKLYEKYPCNKEIVEIYNTRTKVNYNDKTVSIFAPLFENEAHKKEFYDKLEECGQKIIDGEK